MRSLRARVLAATLAITAVGLAIAGAATYAALQRFLLDRVDQQLESAVGPVSRELLRAADDPFPGGRTARVAVPAGTYAELRDRRGAVMNRLVASFESSPAGVGAHVDMPSDLRLGGPGDRRFFTVAGAGGTRYRALAVAGVRGDTFTVAVPLSDVSSTLRRLVAIEVVVAVAVLAALGLVARWAVRLGLRPLDDIAATAGEIAAGDLGRRIPIADDRTEVGRLGQALNLMLERLGAAFAERDAAAGRLRRFVADASHELRTPLTSIRGYAELFRRGAAERPEELATAMRRIEEEGERMGVLVDDLLLLARLDEGREPTREPVDLTVVAADAVTDLHAIEPDRPVTLTSPGPVVVTGDETQLRQVAANLLSNARTHTPAGTAVRVSVLAGDGTAVLEVADDGPGLPPGAAAHVFERFYRADPSRTRGSGGTGLGLAIVAAIAEAHGGRATVSSGEGAGATFRVELPLAGAGGAGGRTGSAPVDSAGGAPPDPGGAWFTGRDGTDPQP